MPQLTAPNQIVSGYYVMRPNDAALIDGPFATQVAASAVAVPDSGYVVWVPAPIGTLVTWTCGPVFAKVSTAVAAA